jgi:hypothetical protein
MTAKIGKNFYFFGLLLKIFKFRKFSIKVGLLALQAVYLTNPPTGILTDRGFSLPSLPRRGRG